MAKKQGTTKTVEALKPDDAKWKKLPTAEYQAVLRKEALADHTDSINQGAFGERDLGCPHRAIGSGWEPGTEAWDQPETSDRSENIF